MLGISIDTIIILSVGSLVFIILIYILFDLIIIKSK